MSRRVLVLSGYFFQSLIFSLTGALLLIGMLAYWIIFFPPGQSTPDVPYFTFVIGVFGIALSFLATLSIASQANRAENYPVVARLPSRVEYLAAVLTSAITFTAFTQIILSLLALISGPTLGLSNILDILPAWIAANILIIVLAFHASELVTHGWSRVWVYGVLALLLIAQNLGGFMTFMAERLNRIASFFYLRDLAAIGQMISNLASWFSTQGVGVLERISGFIFWPFQAITDAAQMGYYTLTQALAPATIVLYATILFLLAADLFATKDLDLTE